MPHRPSLYVSMTGVSRGYAHTVSEFGVVITMRSNPPREAIRPWKNLEHTGGTGGHELQSKTKPIYRLAFGTPVHLKHWKFLLFALGWCVFV